jgi:plastocyanin
MQRPSTARITALLIACATSLLPLSGAERTVRVEVADAKGAKISDAVAWLTSLDTKVKVVPPVQPVVIVQRNEEFVPYVTAVVVGSKVNFPNRDTVQHHVYSLSPAKRFEIPLYRGESKEPILFDQPGIVTLGCNIHDAMSAHIVILETPTFAISGEDGRALLPAVPAGRYRLEVWHPRASATVTREVAVTPSTEPQVIEIVLKADRRIRRAPEPGGGSYR